MTLLPAFINLSSWELAIILAIPFIFVAVAIFLILKRETGIEKILWILAVLFFPFVGATIYFISSFLQKDKTRR
ncbi:PLDc N-terminal domain-containing protein [Sphingobacterium corticis]|uniref:PLDc N-terminal domain-containing protein n=1 Tax=Sphingobacterium corticis TaxID=1812823 RepID=A0ABW5NN77_9SPHI